MNKTAIEVKSTLFKKIFISLIAFPFAAGGIACWVSPFITHQPSDILPAGITGFIVLAAGFLLWWPVMRLFIRADEEGITQITGFFRQSVRWDDVAYYYPEMNRKNDQK